MRDIERIQDMDTYNHDYPVFLNYPEKYYDLKYTDNFITSVDGIKNLCDSNGIMLKVARTAVSQLEEESEESFINVLKTDFALSRKEIEANTGRKVFAFSYPLGIYSSLSEAVLKEMGIKVTLSTEPGTNIIIKGLPQSLNTLKRYSVNIPLYAAL